MVEESQQGHAERSQDHQNHRGQVNGTSSDAKTKDKEDKGYAGGSYDHSKIVEKA